MKTSIALLLTVGITMGFWDWLTGQPPEQQSSSSWDWTTDEADALEDLKEDEEAKDGDDSIFTHAEQNRLGFIGWLFGTNKDAD